jgi:hypothetical protein
MDLVRRSIFDQIFARAPASMILVLLLVGMFAFFPRIPQVKAQSVGTINTGVHYYAPGSLTSAQISFIATHFTLLDVSFTIDISSLQAIKTQNPNMRIFGYKDVVAEVTYDSDWAEVNSHEDWFVHDASGRRIMQRQWGWYLMDVGSAGWRQHLVSYMNSRINNAQYDGALADDVWDTMASWYLSSFSATVPASVISGWHNNVMGMLRYIKANLLPGKILIVNSDEWRTNDYLNIADGQMLDGYEHASYESATSYGRPSIDVLAGKCATGKIVWATSGIDGSTATQTQIDAMLKYCYASFLVGMGASNAYWSWSSQGGAIYTDISVAYQPIMDKNIGQPTGTYYSSQNVYMRDFTGGKVLFNPSTNSYTVNLGQTYTNLAGNSVTSLVLQPHTGDVLVSVGGGAVPPPVPPPSTGNTFGKTTVGALADVNSVPTLQVQRFQLTGSGIVSKLTVYVGGQSSPCNIIGVIYADNAGVPTTLLAKTPITNVAGAAGWRDLVFSSPVSLTAGYYHLGWLSGASTTLTTYYDAGGTHTWNTALQSGARFYPTPPNPFVVERQNAYTFSTYATYTPALSTFGKTTVGALADVNSVPTLQVQRFQLTGSGIVSKLTVYVGGQSSPCNIIGVIYADNAGVPTTLLAKTPITNVAGAAGWRDLVFSSPVSLTAGYYHLGWLSGASTTLTTYYDAGGTHTWNTALQSGARFYPTPPNPFVVERQNAYTFSTYATYTLPS